MIWSVTPRPRYWSHYITLYLICCVTCPKIFFISIDIIECIRKIGQQNLYMPFARECLRHFYGLVKVSVLLKFCHGVYYFCMKKTRDHVFVHCQQGKFQLRANGFMCWMPVANPGILQKTPPPTAVMSVPTTQSWPIRLKRIGTSRVVSRLWRGI